MTATVFLMNVVLAYMWEHIAASNEYSPEVRIAAIKKRDDPLVVLTKLMILRFCSIVCARSNLGKV